MRIYIKFIIILTVFFNNPLYSQDYEVGDLIKFKASIAISNVITKNQKRKIKKETYRILSEDNKTLNRLHEGVVFKIEEIEDNNVSVRAIPFIKKNNTETQYLKDTINGKSVIVKMREGKVRKVYAEQEAGFKIQQKANNMVEENNKTSYIKLYNGIIYKVDKDKFNSAYEKVVPFEFVTLGVISLPIKIRPQGRMSFDTNFNIGATVGVRLNKNKLKPYAVYGQLGLNVGNTELNSSNSIIGEEEEINSTLATGILGFMAQYKKIQVGIYTGVDFISNQKQYDWIYHGKPWLSLGIGIDLFQPKDVQVNGQ